MIDCAWHLRGYGCHGCAASDSAVCVQDERPIKTPEVEEFSHDLYSDQRDELLVSTVTVGPNITDYEVCDMVQGLNFEGSNPD